MAAAIRLHLQGTPIPGNHTLVNIHSDEYDSSLHELNREVWGNLTVPAAREVSLSFERAVATHVPPMAAHRCEPFFRAS